MFNKGDRVKLTDAALFERAAICQRDRFGTIDRQPQSWTLAARISVKWDNVKSPEYVRGLELELIRT